MIINDIESVMELYIIRYYKNKHTSTWTQLLFHALTAGTANRCGVITASVRYKHMIHIDSHNIIIIQAYENLQSVGILAQDGSMFFFFFQLLRRVY